jgi:colicin import membrane protein
MNTQQTAALAPPEPVEHAKVNVIPRYEVLAGDIKEAQENAVLVFDYGSAKGQKEARSYIYGLRLLKGKIESARKDEKAWALAYGKNVDAKAKELTTQVEDLIQPHQRQLEAVEAAEEARKQRHQAVLDKATAYGNLRFGAGSAEIRARLESLDGITIDGLEEFAEPVAAAIVTSRQALSTALEQAEAAEAQAAEVKRLRAEAEERERRDREAQAAREKEEQAEREEEDRHEERLIHGSFPRPAPNAIAPPSPKALASASEPTPDPFETAGHRQAAIEAELDELTVNGRIPTTKEGRLASSLLLAIRESGPREAVAARLAIGTLHPAIRVDWSFVP